MKTPITIIAFVLCLTYTNAQITLDFTVDSTIYGYYFYPTKISDHETKYVFLDTASNTFSLFNLDMTPFLLDVSVPAELDNGNFFYHVMYITRTLFDCDSTNIEYFFAAQNEPWQPLWIIRTDGTVLFYADSSRGPYCLGCPGGTTLQRPILKTESGTKLFIMKNPGVGVTNISVYSLCGTLPTIDEFDFADGTDSYVEIFPNPGADQLNFKVTSPSNLNDYELVILNTNAHEIERKSVNSDGNSISLDVRIYPSGTYYYSLISGKKVAQAGKFVLTK